MKYIGQLLGWILLGINSLVVMLLWVCAYASYINPVDYPALSCMGLAFPIFLVANVLFLFFWLLVYRRYALLPLLGFICCLGAIRIYVPINIGGDDAPEDAVKVLSYNVRYFGDTQPHTKEKPNGVLEYLANSGADVICMQEHWTGGKLSQKDVDYALRDYPYKRIHNALSCYSRFPILSSRPVTFKDTYNAAEIYQLKVGDDTLNVINNHLESNRLTEEDKEVYRDMIKAPDKQKVKKGSRLLLGKLAEAAAKRAVQADSIARLVERYKDGLLIVCGDFNDSPLSYTRRVIGEELDDAFVQSGNGVGISYNRNGFYFRIDHILVSKKLQTYGCTVDRSVKASDHYPIWCHVAGKTEK